MKNMAIEVRAPSRLALVAGVLVALAGIIAYFIPGGSPHAAFWLMTAAYVVTSLFTLVRA